MVIGHGNARQLGPQVLSSENLLTQRLQNRYEAQTGLRPALALSTSPLSNPSDQVRGASAARLAFGRDSRRMSDSQQ